MPFTITTDSPYGDDVTCVASDDDWREFDELLDRHEHNPTRLVAALEKYLGRHPGHVDATAHLVMYADAAGDHSRALILATAAKGLLDAGLAGVDGDVALERSILENRPVLRLALNATLAAWAAEAWELAEELAAIGVRLNADRVLAEEYQAGIARRTDLHSLRHTTAV